MIIIIIDFFTPKGWEPEGWPGLPKGGVPKGGKPNISRFFPPSATVFFLSSLWGSFRGILVKFEAPGL